MGELNTPISHSAVLWRNHFYISALLCISCCSRINFELLLIVHSYSTFSKTKLFIKTWPIQVNNYPVCYDVTIKLSRDIKHTNISISCGLLSPLWNVPFQTRWVIPSAICRQGLSSLLNKFYNNHFSLFTFCSISNNLYSSLGHSAYRHYYLLSLWYYQNIISLSLVPNSCL